MKKMLTISLLVVLALLLVSTVVNATTKSELEAFVIGGHKVDGKTVSLTANEIKQVKDLFASERGQKLTDEQATTIKANLDNIVAVMDKAGVTDYTKLTTAQKEEALKYATAAVSTVGLKINTNNMTVVDESGNVVFKLDSRALVQTGSNNIVYVVLAGLAIIAVAGTVAVRKANA